MGAFLAFEIVSNSHGRTVVIEEGNEVVGSYRLSEDRTIPVQGPLGISTVVIEHGEVYMDDSPCANKVCIDMGKISEKGRLHHLPAEPHLYYHPMTSADPRLILLFVSIQLFFA